MHARSRAAIVVCGAAAVAFAVPGSAGAVHARGSAAGGNSVTVVEHAVTDTVVPTGGGKDVTGNVLTFHNQVFDPSDKRVVGSDLGFCVRISVSDGSWTCEWTTFLAKGQINVAGPYYDAKNSVLAVTGGTGAYDGARGHMNLNSLKGGTEYDFIFHLK